MTALNGAANFAGAGRLSARATLALRARASLAGAGKISATPFLTWPHDLPCLPLVDHIKITPTTNVNAVPMESGRGRQSLQFRPVLFEVALTWKMTGAELEIFQRWVEFDAQFGSAWFSIFLMLDESKRVVTARLMRDPVYEKMGSNRWIVSATLEIFDPPAVVAYTSTWPTTLPNANVSQQKPAAGVVRSDLPGVANQRKRFLQSIERVNVSWRLSGAQLKTFKSFAASAGYGSAWFDIAINLDHECRTLRARFAGDTPPTWHHIGIKRWEVSATLEVINPPPNPPEVVAINLSLGQDLYNTQAVLVVQPTLQPFFTNYAAHF